MMFVCWEFLLDYASEASYMEEQPLCASWESLVCKVNAWKWDSCRYAEKQFLGALQFAGENSAEA